MPIRTPSRIAGAQPSRTRKAETAALRLPRSPLPTESGLPGRQVAARPLQPPAPHPRREDMPSILPAVVAAEAAASHKAAPAHMAAQPTSPETTSSSSFSSSSTSCTSSFHLPLPADHIHKARSKGKAAAAHQAA